MERKKVAILLPWLKMGGTNKVALRFIKELTQYFDVTLILSYNTGELLGEVPENVEVIIDHLNTFQTILREDFRHLKVNWIIKDIIYYLTIKCGKDSIDNYRYLVNRHPLVTSKHFDCAISYHGQSPERLLNLIYRIEADKKVAWIHGEMSFSRDDCVKMAKYYEKMDHLYFVSNHTRESFKRSIPLTRFESDVYYNPLDGTEITSLASETFEDPFEINRINIVTVGRISEEKGQDMIPDIMRLLLNADYDVVWFVIGDGPQKDALQKRIQSLGLEEKIRLLGVKNNPYPYMKKCDIYVQPSYTEGYSTTICEAGILGKAIIGTKPSGGIYDQITDGFDGRMVDASQEARAHAIGELIENPETRERYAKNILKRNFEGKGEIVKFLDYINEE